MNLNLTFYLNMKHQITIIRNNYNISNKDKLYIV